MDTDNAGTSPNPELERVLSRQNPKLIVRGFKKYLKELPKLIEQGNEGHVAVYVKGERVAIAPTKEELTVFLKKNSLQNADGLFVKRITETDLDDYNLRK